MKYLLSILFIGISFCQGQTYNQVLANGNATSLYPNHTTPVPNTSGARYGSLDIQPVAFNDILILDNSYWNGTKFIPVFGGYQSGFILWNGTIYFKGMPSLPLGDQSGVNTTMGYMSYDGTVAFGGNIYSQPSSNGFAFTIWPSKKISIHQPPTGSATDKVLVWHPADSSILQVDATIIGGANGTYIPAVSGVSNVSSPSGSNSFYQQSGKIVHAGISGFCVATTAGTKSSVNINLPISAFYGGGIDIGTGTYDNNGGQNFSSVRVRLISATQCQIEFIPTVSGTGGNFSLQLDYTTP